MTPQDAVTARIIPEDEFGMCVKPTPYLDSFSGIVWELVSLWEHLEPGPLRADPAAHPGSFGFSGVVDRVRAFAGVALLAFFGGRIGEIEPHEGHMWALAAYTPQSFRRCSHEVCLQLEELGFPLHNRKT